MGKYVVHNAEHELNLPSRLRNQLIDCYNKIWELSEFQCEYLFGDDGDMQHQRLSLLRLFLIVLVR